MVDGLMRAATLADFWAGLSRAESRRLSARRKDREAEVKEEMACMLESFAEALRNEASGDTTGKYVREDGKWRRQLASDDATPEVAVDPRFVGGSVPDDHDDR